ncbi:MAG: nuclear transport factor 2 family protein [Chitinophagaceae bacterium]|nr:nuclear transport factor 2 family protein [Chitinophagaceae bacterium]
MKYILLLLTAIISMTMIKAQTTEDSVKAVVNKMFDAMRNGDSESLKSTFSESVVFHTIATSKEGVESVRSEDPKGFIDFVGKEKKGVLDERISFETIKIDGPLAIAWTPYKFYYNGNFSHCGVNSFQLVRINGSWKIQYIIDTRRKTGCE